ncbi:ATP-grasp fold amidoligase family protein [Loktanella sp. DJP18]|uniref:ATP-grasp fold amidoligase family protein n=1 Tax=Loktanella sp. DJP18 TaxID=3409788 RepID=UPI003BB55D9C
MDATKFSKHIEASMALKRRYPSHWTRPFFNKIIGRQFAANFGLRGPDVIAQYPSVYDLPELDTLPTSCVIKPTNGNGNRGVFCIRDGWEIMDALPVSRDTIVATFKASDTISESPVIVEELIVDYSGREGLPRDFKFYNFGNRCSFIHVVERNHRKDQSKNRHWFLNEDRTPFAYQFIKSQKHSQDFLELPPFFDDMLALSKRFSKKLNSFARVDLYAAQTGPIFGEITAYPHGGKGYLEEADLYLGRQWRGYYGASRLDFLKYLKVKYYGH